MKLDFCAVWRFDWRVMKVQGRSRRAIAEAARAKPPDLARGRVARPEGAGGRVVRLCAALVAVIAALSPALAGPVACSTSFQGYRVCSGPGGYTSTETQWQG
jgi:hypothetical protein